MKSKFILTSIASAMLSAFIAPNTDAAENASSDNAQQIEDKLFETIEVTGSRLDRASSATGLPLTVRQTPQSVSIIDREFIDNFALDTLADVLNFAPGIQTQQAETDRFFFRARGRDITNFQFDGVPVIYDSFFSDAVTDSVIFDRVELVRGATGLLTGAGQPSAAINLIRKRPTIDDTGYVRLQLGSWANQRLEFDHSQTLNESQTVKARVAGAYEQGDSYVDLAEKQNLSLYGVLTADITDNTRLTFGIDHSDRNPTASTWGALPLFYSNGQQADDLPTSTTTAANWTKWAREGTNAFAQVEHAFDNGWNVQVEVESRSNEMDGSLLYLFGFPDQQSGLGLFSFPLMYLADRDQIALRAMATGPFELMGREHTLTAGALYSKEDNSFASFSATESLDIPSLFSWDGSVRQPNFSDTPFEGDETETQEGFYIASNFSLSDSLNVIVGNRFSTYEFDTKNGIASDNTEHSGVNTPYLGVVYDINDAFSVYASYTEIFLPQNARNINNERLDPIDGVNYEAGIKGDFFNDKLTASIAVYKVEEDNLATPDPDNTMLLPDGSLPSIGIEGAQTTGFEIELNGRLSDAARLYFSYTSNDSEQASGEPLSPFLPDDMLRTSLIYDLSSQLTLGANLNWQSDISLPNAGPNGETFEQGAYSVVNLMASYRINDDWQLNANVNNVLDEKYFSSIDFFNQGFFGAPRNVELSVRYAW